MDDHEHASDGISVEGLTWREQEVLALLAERLTNREIGDRLYLTENTVKDYVGKILGKLYVKNRRQAVERARALGLLAPDGQVPSSVAPKPLNNLPAQSKPFIGRSDYLAEIARLLSETRLLTLTGPGGMGKTSLALQAASGLLDHFEHSVFFVPLAPISSGKHVAQTVAEAINSPLSTDAEPVDQLLAHLRRRQLLLVMDNFEHVLNGADVVSAILEGAAGATVLATSREKLNLQGETTLSIIGMDFPAWEPSGDLMDYDAIQLFTHSARRANPRFEPVDDDLKHLAAICEMAQGMPLAIELAAAWTEVLSPQEIAEELQKGFDILSTDMRDVPERHRSIRAVFDSAWSLLDPSERDVFMRLSVFRGGFTREAAEQVAGASVQSLARLVSKSLLHHHQGAGRFEVHELLRQYAQERLAETPEVNASVHEAHAAYFAGFMRDRWDHLKDSRQVAALAEIEADIENARTAWRYAINQGNATQIRMFLNSFRILYYVRGWYLAGTELFGEAVEALRQPAPDDEEAVAVGALALSFQGYFMGMRGLSEEGYELARHGVETLERLNHPHDLALALAGLGITAFYLLRYDEAGASAHRMLEIATAMDDKSLMTNALYLLCADAIGREDFASARQFAEDNLKVSQEMGDGVSSVMAFLGLGHAICGLGTHEEARGFYQRALQIAEMMGFRWAIGNATKYLGQVALALDEIQIAETHFLENLRIAEEIGLEREKARLLYELARVRVAQNRPERAVELLAIVSQQPASQQSRMGQEALRDSAQDLLVSLEAGLSPEVYASALERGQALGLDEIVTEILRAQG